MLFKLLDKLNGKIHTTIFMLCSLTYVYLTFFNFTFTEWLTATLGGLMVFGVVISAYYHRYCSHRSYKMPRWAELIMLYGSTAMLQQPAMGWAATHISHHKYADQEGDPHGHMHSLLDNFLVFNKVPPIRTVPRWMFRDKAYLIQANFYWEIAIVLLAILFATIGWKYVVSFIAITYLSQIIVNISGHTKELQLHNNELMSVPLMGEMYHGSHHWKPSNPKFGRFDIPYYLLIKWLNKISG